MDVTALKEMTEAQLRSYIEFLLWHYRVVDGFWFLFVSDDFNQQTAERINERVWAKAPELAARNLLGRFKMEEKGLAGFVKALRLFPWCIIIGFDIEQKPDEVVITVPSCPPQAARIRKGLPEFSCKEMHRGEFASFARVIDPAIRVQCDFAPPDPHPIEYFCRWHFTIDEDSNPGKGE